MQTEWYDRMIQALQLNGKGERTQEAYARAVRMLIEFQHQAPDEITAEALQAYFLHRRNVSQWSPATLRICYAGIRFFFEKVLQRDWPLLQLLRAQRERKLPAVLSVEEVRRVLGCVHTFHNSAFLTTVYSCGLRLQEGLHLEVADIDSARMMVHVHRGKGAKDRYVPLPGSTLALLRTYWRTHRNPTLLFPAIGRGHQAAPVATTPMAPSSVQGAFRQAVQAAGIHKRQVSLHTLRHCYATHLLEAGVNIRTIQRYMGHTDLETTMVHLHLTQKGQEDAYQLIDTVMGGLDHGPAQ
jgi:integrase/recombinase XerD